MAFSGRFCTLGVVKDSVQSRAVPQTHLFGCNLCEAMCGLQVSIEAGRITDIRGDPDDVFSRGHICPKGPALRELYETPERLRTPMRRTATGFEPIGWDEAFAEAAARLREIRARDGNDAVAFYIGNPAAHGHRAALGVQLLGKVLRTHNLFNPCSQDSNPKLFACQQMYGDPLSVPIPDVDRIDFLLMLGANPVASNGSMWALGDARARLTAIRKRGGKIVLLDPRRNETAALCDEHHFVRPGSDAALLLAMLQVIFAEQLLDPAAVDAMASGRERLASLCAPFTPDRVAGVVGLEAEVIRRLARTLATTPRAAVYGRLGTCQNEFGPLASWLIEALNLVTGHFDRAGGAMFSHPAADLGPLTSWVVSGAHGRWRSRVRGLPEFLEALPSAVMAEEMETPGKGQIRALVCYAGDPVLSTPNGPRLGKAIEGLEYVVAIDFFLNETSRRAHLVFPPTHIFESGNYELLLSNFAVRNFARYSPAILTPAPGSRDDWEILGELAVRIAAPWLGPVWRRFGKELPEKIIDLLLGLGREPTSLAELQHHPHGLDLGPLRPAREQRVRTIDGRARLVPEVLAADLPRLERWLETRAAAPPGLVLIGRRHLRSNNSWMHNLYSLVKGPSRSQLLMHPQDAADRAVVEGARVTVRSRVGAIDATVKLTEDLQRGVVCLPHGFGHQGGARGPNVNALTDELFVEPVLGTSILNGLPVDVSASTPGGDHLG